MGKLKQKAYRAIGKLIGLPRTRKFDGKVYYLATKGTGMTKLGAEKYATKLRKGGDKARVVKTTIAKWCVYIA